MSNWNDTPTEETMSETVKNLTAHGINVTVVKNAKDALEKIREFIPEDSEIAAGTSTTLNEIGFSDLAQSDNSPWKNLSTLAWAENDQEKRGDLRRKALTAEYFLGSVNAITEDGKLVAVDSTGSRVGAYPFAAKKIVLVVGVNKITKNLDEAMTRIKEYVFPLEDARAKEAYGTNSSFGKWVIIENEVNKNRIHLILVEEKLGF